MGYQRGGRPNLIVVRVLLAQLIRRTEMAHAEHYVVRTVPNSVREVVPVPRVSLAFQGELALEGTRTGAAQTHARAHRVCSRREWPIRRPEAIRQVEWPRFWCPSRGAPCWRAEASRCARAQSRQSTIRQRLRGTPLSTTRCQTTSVGSGSLFDAVSWEAIFRTHIRSEIVWIAAFGFAAPGG